MDSEIIQQTNLKNGDGIVSTNPMDYLITIGDKGYLPLTRYREHQLQVLQKNPHRFKVCIWHRKAWKTTTAITEIVKQAHLRVGVYWHIFPTYGEAKDSVWRDPNMLFNIIPKDLIERVNETELVVYFKNGSIYQLKGSDQPDALRGPNPFGVVFDEYDTQKMGGWGVVEPIIRANGGWVWFIGTPRGKNKLYDLYNRGQEGHHEWKSWLLKASTSGIVALDQLAESKKTMSQALYNQEWECDFLEGEGSVFRNVRNVMTARPHDPKTPQHKNTLYVMGVDVAKVTDYTVISVFDREHNEQIFQDRFKTIEWPFQKRRIQAISRHFNNALVVLDATGIGDPIADDLLRSGVSVEPFKITEQTKKDLIEKLSIWIEQKKIKLLNKEETLLEYDNFSYEIGPTGKIRYGARLGYHDDIVLSHALAVYSLQPIYEQEKTIEPTPLQVHFARATRRWEQEDEQPEWTEWEQAL